MCVYVSVNVVWVVVVERGGVEVCGMVERG